MTLAEAANQASVPDRPIVEAVANDEPAKEPTKQVKQQHAELLADRRAHEREVYQARKEQGLCTRCGDPAAEDAQLCEPCLEYQRNQTATSTARSRARRRKAGRCEQCGKPSKRWRCLVCLARAGRLPKSALPSRTNQNVNQNRRDADGRLRHHGTGKRGNQPTSVKDGWDLKLIVSSCARALEVNDAIARLGELPSDERQLLDLAKLGHVDIIRRVAEEILERGKYDERSAKAEAQRSKARAAAVSSMAPKMRGR